MSRQGYLDIHYVRELEDEVDYPSLQDAVETEVCIVGGGLAGLNTALGLVERRKNVLLIEAKRIAWAASGRNGGFVDKGYAAGEVELAQKIGLARAKPLVALTKDARQLIKKRIETYKIDCGPLIHGVLNVSCRSKPESLKRYIDRANRDFELEYEFWPREKVQALCHTAKYYDAFFSPQDFQFDPLRYAHGIAKAITLQGGKIFENTPALRLLRAGKCWHVITPQAVVKAQHVVLCCSYLIGDLDKRLSHAMFPVETYVMATAPLPSEVLEKTVATRFAIYELRFAANYYRRLEGNRLLWGGRVALGSKAVDVAQAMTQDAIKIYPQLQGYIQPQTAWSGILCYAPHKMPQLGFFEEGYWYNTAFGGHGLCATTAAGEVMADAITGTHDTFKRFARFRPFYIGGKMGQYVAQTVYFWWRARDYLGL